MFGVNSSRVEVSQKFQNYFVMGPIKEVAQSTQHLPVSNFHVEHTGKRQQTHHQLPLLRNKERKKESPKQKEHKKQQRNNKYLIIIIITDYKNPMNLFFFFLENPHKNCV
jgi:hypothetical protein